MNDECTPLFTDLVEHAKRKMFSFHIQGHKKEERMENPLKLLLGKNT
ncbi:MULTISPECIES: hypothetical protein [unclassified Bacillus (in: firmicutes)]|nr:MULTISPECIES: hypothetical protein [unclassified Bacillus (in: firmicutes)]MBY7125681.1 hypothetical protein [Bacillus sp. 16GRE42]MCR6850116.1 hypothetical protein [Bacillus sp. IBL03825]